MSDKIIHLIKIQKDEESNAEVDIEPSGCQPTSIIRN